MPINIAADPQDLLLRSFEIAYDAAHPDRCIADVITNFMPAYVPNSPDGRVIVIGAGKASAAMASAFEAQMALHHAHIPIHGVVVTRYGHGVPTQHIKIIEAAHPVPDDAGLRAVDEIFDVIADARADDVIICLISGGGSALLSAPVDGVSFAALQGLSHDLLKSGASIHEMNCVRKHLNRALGGGLAQAAMGKRMMTLAISDVTGDDPAVIASGASVLDPSTLKQARDVIARYGITPADEIMAALNDSRNETPKPNDSGYESHAYHLIATPHKSLIAAQDYWQDQGFDTHILDTEMDGDTNACAAQHIDFIADIYAGRVDRAKLDITKPCAIISGGETTVRVRGDGNGGPNTQFMLQAALLLGGHDFGAKIYGLACDTDGVDGSADNAGAIITPDTLQRAAGLALDADAFLSNNDSYTFFDALGDLVKTGATYTNVNDYRVFLLLP